MATIYEDLIAAIKAAVLLGDPNVPVTVFDPFTLKGLELREAIMDGDRVRCWFIEQLDLSGLGNPGDTSDQQASLRLVGLAGVGRADEILALQKNGAAVVTQIQVLANLGSVVGFVNGTRIAADKYLCHEYVVSAEFFGLCPTS